MESAGGRTLKGAWSLFGALALLSVGPPVGMAKEPAIVMEEFTIPAVDPGIELYVRNKHPRGATRFSADKILLFVHGATYPSETTFDLKLNGLSWMDYIAQHGYDVYLVDVRGFGKSTRPPEMNQPAEDNAPIVRTDTAVKDVAATIDFILRRRGASKLNLMGWSWGTSIMGWYATQHNERVNRLVLYAPLWISTSPQLVSPNITLGAYRSVTREAARSRWLKGVPEDRKSDLIPAGWFDAWADATFASDPLGASQTPPVLRAPNGAVQDGREFWSAGKMLYDPAAIRVPTLLAHAEWDADLPSYMVYEYFARLTNAPYKRYVQIGEGTHTIIMEKNRMQLFEAVQQFLDERFTPGQ
jgi:pimeloyl-ACP methyl ester carboxylesterase